MAKRLTKTPPDLLCAALNGAWRKPHAAPEISPEELTDIVPLLNQTATAAFVWWRIRQTDLRTAPAAVELHQAYRLQTIQAAVHEQTIKDAVQRLRAVNIEPVLVKGWAIACLYPEQGLRPYGDIDLCVRSEQHETAASVIKSVHALEASIDLHREFDRLDDEGWNELYARSRLVQLDDTNVRVLGNEDHLRLLCVHLLREGAWRPLWLCDIAVMLDGLASGFDWNVCLGTNRRRADWVACAVGLAHQLLGATVAETPFIDRTQRLPRWLASTVLKEWGRPLLRHRRYGKLMENYLRHPSGLMTALRSRWPNPVEATARVNGSFNELPRLPFQLAECFQRVAQFAPQLPRLWRARR